MKKKNGSMRVIICFAIIAVIVLVYYNHTQQKAAEMTHTEETVESSKVQDVILRNLDSDYPPSPKEVVKFYSEISQCLYGEKYSEDELEKMADRMRKAMEKAAKELEFMEAARLRDEYLAIQKLIEDKK